MNPRLKMTVSGKRTMFKELEQKLFAETQRLHAAHVEKLLDNLAIATPIDTGNARASWEAIRMGNNIIKVINSVPYIERLNAGHSRQAPPFFVETVAIRYGKPIGIIAEAT